MKKILIITCLSLGLSLCSFGIGQMQVHAQVPADQADRLAERNELARQNTQIQFQPMTNIFGVSKTPTFADYINMLFGLLISVCALLAVIRIALSGFKYMFSEAWGEKSNAKEEITASLAGLLIIVAAVIILQYINPCMLNIGNIFSLSKDTQCNPSAVMQDTNR